MRVSQASTLTTIEMVFFEILWSRKSFYQISCSTFLCLLFLLISTFVITHQSERICSECIPIFFYFFLILLVIPLMSQNYKHKFQIDIASVSTSATYLCRVRNKYYCNLIFIRTFSVPADQNDTFACKLGCIFHFFNNELSSFAQLNTPAPG